MWLQISSGKGPEECELAVGLFLKTMMKENKDAKVIGSVPGRYSGTFKSVFLSIDQDEANNSNAIKTGTILWIC